MQLKDANIQSKKQYIVGIYLWNSKHSSYVDVHYPVDIINQLVMLNEAKTSRPRPELWGRGQFLKVEAKAEAKNNYEKVPNNH